jgi:glycosyltransferase involved in cell wall biosynthesis
MATTQSVPFSVIIPAYNEERGIKPQLESIHKILQVNELDYEIIVVDDGSLDKTAEEARSIKDVTVIQHPKNRGYGAALKTGILSSKYETVVIIDADGTYPAKELPEMIKKATEFDMIVGARIGPVVQIPSIRKPAKWFLQKLASYLAEEAIPDLNSGLRVMKKSVVKQFFPILPAGFSFTTTITLALLCNDYLVHYHTIEYHSRVGKSKIRPLDAYHFLLLILRTIVYFNPLRIFLPLGGMLFTMGLIKFIYDLFLSNLSETAIFGFLSSFIIWAIGLLSDQIAKMGLGLKTK